MRHGWNVLVPEVQFENLRSSRDLAVSEVEGRRCITDAHAKQTIRVVAKLEDILPFAE
jgi:hypothetical protein